MFRLSRTLLAIAVLGCIHEGALAQTSEKVLSTASVETRIPTRDSSETLQVVGVSSVILAPDSWRIIVELSETTTSSSAAVQRLGKRVGVINSALLSEPAIKTPLKEIDRRFMPAQNDMKVISTASGNKVSASYELALSGNSWVSRAIDIISSDSDATIIQVEPFVTDQAIQLAPAIASATRQADEKAKIFAAQIGSEPDSLLESSVQEEVNAITQPVMSAADLKRSLSATNWKKITVYVSTRYHLRPLEHSTP